MNNNRVNNFCIPGGVDPYSEESGPLTTWCAMLCHVRHRELGGIKGVVSPLLLWCDWAITKKTERERLRSFLDYGHGLLDYVNTAYLLTRRTVEDRSPFRPD